MADEDVQPGGGTGTFGPGSGRPGPPGPPGDDPGGRRTRRTRGRLRWLANPAWERAAFLLPRFPGLLVAVVGAAFVLAIAGASQPLFLSSASNQALRANLSGLCPW